MFRGKLASLGGIVAAIVLGAITPAVSAPRLNLAPPSDNRSSPSAPVGHYIAVQGQSFVLDRGSAVYVTGEATLHVEGDGQLFLATTGG